MDVFGRGYVIDHALSALKRSNREELYRNYVTDALKYIVNNSAGQESRTMLNLSFRELTDPVTKEEEEDNDKKAKMIIDKMKKKLGGG